MTKQELEQKIEELQKQLDELKKVKVEEPKKKWIPAKNDEYYYIKPSIGIVREYFNNDAFDKQLMEMGNFFKTEEEAQFVLDKIKYTLMFKHYVEEHSEPLDWNDKEQGKWYICYDYLSNKIDFFMLNILKIKVQSSQVAKKYYKMLSITLA